MYIVLLSHLGVVLDVFGACKKRLQLIAIAAIDMQAISDCANKLVAV